MKKILAFALMIFMALSISAEAGHGNGKGKSKGKHGSPGNSAYGHSRGKKNKSTTVTVTRPVRYVTIAPGAIVVRDGRSYYGTYELVSVSSNEWYYLNGKGKKVMIKVK